MKTSGRKQRYRGARQSLGKLRHRVLHKEGQGRSESAQIQRGRDTPLTAKSGMEFVTISNLDALGLWDRQGQAGEDSLELTLLCPTEYKGSSKPRP